MLAFMYIAYCTNVRLPSERAHGHQIAQVCDALIHLGHAVHLFCPFRKNVVEQDYWTYYGAEKAVEITYMGSYDFIRSPLPGPLKLWAMNRSMRNALASELKPGAFDLLYTRTPALLPALLATGIPTVLELHQLPRRGKRAFVRHASRCALVAALTTPMKETLIAWGMPADRVIAEGDGVDLKRFERVVSLQDSRKKFHLQTERLVVGYVGRLKTLGMDKGVADILKAVAAMRQEKKFLAFIVGGPEEDRREYEAQAAALGLTAEDACFTGEIPAADVPLALAACDILAMPFPDFPHYRRHMSPLKMFEYMAANRPLVTSDLPTVRDVLNESNAFFCAPGDAASLASALRRIADNPEAAKKVAAKAAEDVKRHTWEERMGRVLGPLVSG
jgi:glycosyltransferase involved in cell wall biosynthesis